MGNVDSVECDIIAVHDTIMISLVYVEPPLISLLICNQGHKTHKNY